VSDTDTPSSEAGEGEDAVGGWAETRDYRIALTLEATAAQRLEWLEQAIELAHKAGALPRPR
jgi:hypothetical protein